MSEELISAVLIKHEIKKLLAGIEAINKQNEILQRRLFWLSIVTSVLTFVQVFFIFFKN
jgi:hypothetical protein